MWWSSGLGRGLLIWARAKPEDGIIFSGDGRSHQIHRRYDRGLADGWVPAGTTNDLVHS
ncbi:hypothetical protein GCM10012275_34930 [Longimycelium tulufanense]|uniref:Uncharacterized protein n=1 Tax=Longimycelium tulufanense TaxID=907463 RepID=A0A8J3FXB9_9PSEU|nr:hypothetical protein GCM10012275_34930 [Longimycelium tulufanense]